MSTETHRQIAHEVEFPYCRMQSVFRGRIELDAGHPEGMSSTIEVGTGKVDDPMIQRMTENDKIVTRYMDDEPFQRIAFPILAREIYETIRNNPEGA